MKHKLVGCCTLCDKPVFEIIKKYSNVHPLAKEPRQIGKPLESAKRMTFVLKDGSQMAVTFCDKCIIAPEIYHKIWEKVLNTFKREITPDYIKILGNEPDTPKQHESKVSMLLSLVNNVPLALLTTQKWVDING